MNKYCHKHGIEYDELCPGCVEQKRYDYHIKVAAVCLAIITIILVILLL